MVNYNMLIIYISISVGLFSVITLAQSSITIGSVKINWIRYKTINDQTNFTIQSSLGDIGTSNIWVGIGLNNNARMNGADVFICRNSPNIQWVRHYITSNYQIALKDANPTYGLSNSAISVNSGSLQCSFTVDNDIAYLNNVDFTQAFLIVAFGLGI
jgi:hypothetical protein